MEDNDAVGVQRFKNLLLKTATERSFFDPHLPFMNPGGERWDALFSQMNKARLGGLLGMAAGGTSGYLLGSKLFHSPIAGLIGLPIGLLGGAGLGAHLTYESLRDTIPLTKKELQERDPMFRLKRLMKYPQHMERIYRKSQS